MGISFHQEDCRGPVSREEREGVSMSTSEKEPSLREVAGNSKLAKLVREVCKKDKRNAEEWLDMAIEPLPETARLNPLRNDIEWTIKKLESIGAKPLKWFPLASTERGLIKQGKENEGGAWQFPWARGKPPNEETKLLVQSLHETGRITRQEAASMLPILIMQPQSGEKILDLCAAPGSKTTQAAEAMKGKGLVLANEKNPGRSNLLSTNRNRIGVSNISICCHDGRHFPKTPLPGFDAILADVPCTGTATTRKNKALWWNWSPNTGIGMQRLQIGILARAAKLVRPNGRIVYSTCSIDPIENELVIAAILQQCPWLELQEISPDCHPNLILGKGFSEWDGLEKYPLEVTQELEKCRRLQLGRENTSGFFVALLKHIGEGEIAEALITDPDWIPTYRKLPIPSRHTPVPLAEERKIEMLDEWEVGDTGLAWFSRGKAVSMTSVETLDWLHTPERPAGNKKMWPGGHWHPIKILHAGIPAFEKRGERWRPKGTVLYALGGKIGGPNIHLSEEEMISLLQGNAVELDNIQYPKGIRGPIIAKCKPNTADNNDSLKSKLLANICVGAWIGERLTTMTNNYESNILLMQLGVDPFTPSTIMNKGE